MKLNYLDASFYPSEHEPTSQFCNISKKIGVAVCSVIIGPNLVVNYSAIDADIRARNDSSTLSRQTSEIASQMLEKDINVSCNDKAFTNLPDDIVAYVRPYRIVLPTKTLVHD